MTTSTTTTTKSSPGAVFLQHSGKLLLFLSWACLSYWWLSHFSEACGAIQQSVAASSWQALPVFSPNMGLALVFFASGPLMCVTLYCWLAYVFSLDPDTAKSSIFWWYGWTATQANHFCYILAVSLLFTQCFVVFNPLARGSLCRFSLSAKYCNDGEANPLLNMCFVSWACQGMPSGCQCDLLEVCSVTAALTPFAPLDSSFQAYNIGMIGHLLETEVLD